MLIYPKLDPIAFTLGPIKVHWYGIMYLIGFAGAFLLGTYRAKKQPWTPLQNANQVGDVIFYGALGVIIGGRLGYMLFYQFWPFIHKPWLIFRVWDGGMSFHGGLIGVIIVLLIMCHRFKCHLWDLGDFLAPMVPIGLAAGRLGNFINGELWGRVTDSRFGMVFPSGGPLPRYPSQLLELFLEGIVLFMILWWTSLKPRRRATLSALFLIFYGIFRTTAEFFREPDPQLGFLFGGWMTMGMLLSIPMVLIGVGLLIYARKRYAKPQPAL